MWSSTWGLLIYFTSVAELMMTGVFGTSDGNGPPAPVGVALMLLTTSMPLTTLPKTVYATAAGR